MMSDNKIWITNVGFQPKWLANAVAAAKSDAGIFEAPDGTFVVWYFKSEDHLPIFGVPTKELAERVLAEIKTAFDEGYACGSNAASD